MATVSFFNIKDGSVRTVDLVPGRSIMEVAIKNNIRGIEAECGGSCSCATCHVYVDERDLAQMAPPDDMEQEMLDGVAAERRVGSRLSCQLRPPATLETLTVYVPERQT
jgi:ferredoxin, 2Fe-2S